MRSAESQTTDKEYSLDGTPIPPNTTLDQYTISNAYAYTIKGTSRYPTYDQYRRILTKWDKKLSFHPQLECWELDTLGKLHVHGIALARPNYLTCRLNKKTYSVDVSPLEDEQDFKIWYNYCTQEPQNYDEISKQQFLESYSIRHHPYPFL